MLCKRVNNETEAEELVWQPLGSANDSPSPKRPGVNPKSRAVGTALMPASDHDGAGLRRRMAEMEVQHARDLEAMRQNGVEQGLKQGRQEAAAEMESALGRVARSLQDLAQVKRKARHEAEAELVQLSLAVARRILHREIMTDADSLVGLVNAALRKLQSREVIRVRTYPGNVQAVRAALERGGGLAGIEVVGEVSLQPGGLVFETAMGELDASTETQLKEIERGFADRLGHW